MNVVANSTNPQNQAKKNIVVFGSTNSQVWMCDHLCWSTRPSKELLGLEHEHCGQFY